MLECQNTGVLNTAGQQDSRAAGWQDSRTAGQQDSKTARRQDGGAAGLKTSVLRTSTSDLT
jgi:hypothetical protein